MSRPPDPSGSAGPFRRGSGRGRTAVRVAAGGVSPSRRAAVTPGLIPPFLPERLPPALPGADGGVARRVARRPDPGWPAEGDGGRARPADRPPRATAARPLATAPGGIAAGRTAGDGDADGSPAAEAGAVPPTPAAFPSSGRFHDPVPIAASHAPADGEAGAVVRDPFLAPPLPAMCGAGETTGAAPAGARYTVGEAPPAPRTRATVPSAPRHPGISPAGPLGPFRRGPGSRAGSRPAVVPRSTAGAADDAWTMSGTVGESGRCAASPRDPAGARGAVSPARRSAGGGPRRDEGGGGHGPRRLRAAVMAMAVALAGLAGTVRAETLVLDLGEGTASAQLVRLFLLITALALAPSLLVMVTAFTRIVIALSLLRSALGLQQSPPNMVLVGIALFATFFVMAPQFERAWQAGILPLLEERIGPEEALVRAAEPFRTFMLRQAREEDLALFFDLAGLEPPAEPAATPWRVLVPAFVVGELRRAFEIGFLLFLPFVVIDLVVASLLMGMGMMMLPPVMVSMPFKLIFFVLVDGWRLVMGGLVASFGPLP